jgi:hypothetical protein
VALETGETRLLAFGDRWETGCAAMVRQNRWLLEIEERRVVWPWSRRQDF